MTRRSILTLAMAATVIGLMPAAAVAAPPEGYRVIKYRHADGSFATAAGCIGTQIFFGSTDAVYGGRPGPVNKQAGPTDVLVIVSDICAATGPVKAAAAEPGGSLIALWQGQAMIGLQSNAQFSVASVHADVPVTDDISGALATARIDMTWTSTGRATRDPSHIHVRFPGEAVVNSHDNNTMVDATAAGTISIGGFSVDVWTSDARLSSVKAGCQVMVHPKAADSDVDCV